MESIQSILFPTFKVLGGLALFLFGMKFMSEGLEAAAGSSFKNILERITKNRFIGVITGTVITAVIQSSSATTVMVVGFVNAGLMSLAQSVGVIMGANIGTTITGIIVSLKIGDYAPLAIFIGVLFILMAKSSKRKHQGQIIAGLGILFLGMTIMGDTLKPLAENETALSFFEQAQNPFVGLLVGVIFTALIQSSSATIGILVTLGSAGLLDLQSAVFVLYGACIGTCVTALISSIGTTKTAKRVVVVHFAFNVIGTLIFTVITLLPLGYVDLLERLIGDNVGRQIAIAAVVFKLTTTALLFPFANYLIKIANLVVPDKGDEDKSKKRLLYLDERIFATPHIIVEQAHKEVERMAKLALENYRLATSVFLDRDSKDVETIKENEELINFLNHEITRFLVKISAIDLDTHDRKMIGAFHHILTDIERVGDHAENIMEFSTPFIEDKNLFSETGLSELREMVGKVEEILEATVKAFESREYDEEEIKRIKKIEDQVDDMRVTFQDNHIERLSLGKCNPFSGMLFMNMLTDLERVSDHAENIVESLTFEKKAQTV